MPQSYSYIIDYQRTPLTPTIRGALTNTRPDQLAAETVHALFPRLPHPLESIEDLVLGCAFPEGEQGLNIIRCVVLESALPDSVGGFTEPNPSYGVQNNSIEVAEINSGCGFV